MSKVKDFFKLYDEIKGLFIKYANTEQAVSGCQIRIQDGSLRIDTPIGISTEFITELDVLIGKNGKIYPYKPGLKNLIEIVYK